MEASAMTPFDILTELAKSPRLLPAKTIQERCGSSVTCTSLVTLWNLAHGKCIKGEPLKTHRQHLLAAGYIESIEDPHGARAANNKTMRIYQTTFVGDRIVENLRYELKRICERIEKKI
jgi:hypothetical protein